MSKKIRILTSAATNPWFNLATENLIFTELDTVCHTLFLWRNTETVVIGSYQNPWAECKIDKMGEDNIFLARRESGGGAVFHDLGNTNFTFLSPKSEYDQDANFKIIIDALKKLDITASLSGRNDLLVGDKKVSGSAFKHKPDRIFHHGTLLVNTNMEKLSNYLNPHPLKLAAKGIKSVRSRVANLVEYNPDINHEVICQSIIESFCKYYGETVEVEILDKNMLASNTHLANYYNKMSNWDWRFGKTPKFSHQMETRFDWGIIDLHLDVKSAIITDVTIFSDSLDVELISALQNVLVNCIYQPNDIKVCLDKLIVKNSEWKPAINDLQTWIISEVKKIS